MEQKGWAWQGQTAKRAKTSKHARHVLCQSTEIPQKSLFFLCSLVCFEAFLPTQNSTALLAKTAKLSVGVLQSRDRRTSTPETPMVRHLPRPLASSLP